MISRQLGLWKNAHCDATRGYVCKRPVDVVTTVKTDPPTTPVPGYCPAGYFGVGLYLNGALRTPSEWAENCPPLAKFMLEAFVDDG